MPSWRDAIWARRPLDRLTIWVRRTGWRPADVAQSDPHAPFVLANVLQYSATRGRNWALLAVGLFALGAALNNILLTRVASLSLMTKLLLAVAVTSFLMALARPLQPQPADQFAQAAMPVAAKPPC